MPADTAQFAPSGNPDHLPHDVTAGLAPGNLGTAIPSILGVPMKALSLDEVIAAIAYWVANGERTFICTADVHALMASRADPALRQIYDAAAFVTPDGMPLVWYLRRHGFPQAKRVCGPDLMPAVIGAFEKQGFRHFFYGTSEQTLQVLKAALEQRFPLIRIVGTYSPPYRDLTPEEAAAVDRMLNDAAPDIIWVGLGAPKQDRWMADHRAALNAPVLIGVGAAFDMIAGTVRRAPGLLQRTGLEWTFRIAQEPRRLLKRYVVSNSKFALALIAEKLNPSPFLPKF